MLGKYLPEQFDACPLWRLTDEPVPGRPQRPALARAVRERGRKQMKAMTGMLDAPPAPESSTPLSGSARMKLVGAAAGTAPDTEQHVSAINGIRVGIGGWTYAPWRNNFYPEGLVQRRELEYASRRLSTIEVNGTFYGAQKPSTYARWASETPEDFVFSLKAPQHVTQRGPLAKATRAAHGFLTGGLAELGHRLGPVLWQFPPSRPFEPDDLAPFLEALPRQVDGLPLRHVLEVRHDSFVCPEFVELARRYGIAAAYADSSEHPQIGDITTDFVYARLMSSRAELSHGYRPAQLDQWSQRAREWARGGDPADLPHVMARREHEAPRDVFIYFISSAKQRNPAAATALLTRLAASQAA